MAKKQSAGLLVYRRAGEDAEVFIAHMGAPYWAKKDQGAWSIPKGEYDASEEPLTAAKREFEEEIGQLAPSSKFLYLGEVNRQDGKNIKVWATEGDIDSAKVKSNTFEMEWPPKSGRVQKFPEIDRAEWFSLEEACQKLNTEQDEFIRRLAAELKIELKAVEEPKQNSLF